MLRLWFVWLMWFCCLFTSTALQFPLPGVDPSGSSQELGFGSSVHCGCQRWGEARHPGPDLATFTISFSNPSGVWGRGKEAHILDLPNGILTFAETHLSSVSLPKSTSFLRSAASRLQRRLRVLPAPSWPHAKKATAEMLSQLTDNIVLNCHGPRFISADLNGTEADFPHLGLWESHGWVEVQSLWLLPSGDPIPPTCQGLTRPDRLYLSPELAAWFVSFELRDVFADHSTLIATLQVACDAVPRMRWPVTTKIPWTSVDLHSWASSCHTVPASFADAVDSTAFLKAFGKSYEASFSGYCVWC